MGTHESWSYWAALAIAFVIVLVVYYQSHTKEAFFQDATGTGTTTTTMDATTDATTGVTGATDTTDTTTGVTGATGSTTAGVTGATGAAAPPGEYVESLQGFPQVDAMQMYFTSFSDRVKVGTRGVYDSSSARWYNFVNPSVFLTIISSTIPSVIGQGLPTANGFLLSNVQSSALAAQAPTSYELGPFTLAFYVRFDRLAFTSPQPVNLFRAYAEDDKWLIVQLVPGSTTDKVKVEAKIGTGGIVYSWEFAKTQLLSGGNYVTLTLVYDKKDTGGKINLYVGSNGSGLDLQPDAPVRLAISNFQFAANQNLEGNLRAIAYFKAPLAASEVTAMDEYFLKENTGMVRELAVAAAVAQAERRAIETRLQEAMGSLADATAKCAAATQGEADKEDPAPKFPNKWTIRPFGNISTFKPATDYDKYNGLLLAQFRTIKELAADAKCPAPAADGAPAAPAPRFKIPYPPASAPYGSKDPNVGTVTRPTLAGATGAAVGAAGATGAAGAVGVTGAAMAAGASHQLTTDSQEWKDLIEMIKELKNNGQTKEADNLTKTAYEELRKQIATDKTLANPPVSTTPAPALFASLQDTSPAKVPAPEQGSWMSRMADWMWKG